MSLKVFLKSSLRDLYVGLSICMHTQSFRKKDSPIFIPSSGHYVSDQSLFQYPVITSVSSPYIIQSLRQCPVIIPVSSHYISVQSLYNTVITSVSSHYISHNVSVQSLHQCPVIMSVSSHDVSVQALHQCPVNTSVSSHYMSVCSPPPPSL